MSARGLSQTFRLRRGMGQARVSSALNAAAVAGSVVHAAAEIILKQLITDGVGNTRSNAAAQAMRKLGGSSIVLSDALNDAVRKECANPSFTESKTTFLKQMEARMPRMREALQEILANRKVLPCAGAFASVARQSDPQRRGLWHGTHFEVDLRDAGVMWKGRVDILVLSDEVARLRTSRLGKPDDSDRLQLHIYALLWDADGELNRRYTPVISLQLGYGGGVVFVNLPTQDDSTALKKDFLERTIRIRQELGRPVVPARPSPENCRYC